MTDLLFFFVIFCKILLMNWLSWNRSSWLKTTGHGSFFRPHIISWLSWLVTTRYTVRKGPWDPYLTPLVPFIPDSPLPPPPPTLFWLSDVAWFPHISPSSPSFLSRLPSPFHPRVFPHYTSPLLLLKTDIEQWLDLLQVSLRKATKYKAESRASDQNTSIQDAKARTWFVLVKILNCLQCFLLW